MSRVTVRMSATRTYQRNEHAYYTVMQDLATGQYRWEWHENGEAPDSGPWLSTISGALRHAAGNWDACGDGGNLAGRLRRAAAAYAKRETAQ